MLPGLKSRVIERVEEFSMEIDTGTDEIAKQALEHIHTNEVILTVGHSRTVERFLKQAAKERKFQVRLGKLRWSRSTNTQCICDDMSTLQ